MKNERRRFAGKLVGGLFGSFFVGSTLAKCDKPKPNVNESSEGMEPDSKTMLVLQGQNTKPTGSNSLSYIYSNNQYENRVEMSVGKDNRLWIKVDGKWHRVAVE
jgi:hypothetical protein